MAFSPLNSSEFFEDKTLALWKTLMPGMLDALPLLETQLTKRKRVPGTVTKDRHSLRRL